MGEVSVVSDVHAAFGALARVAATGRPLVVLGDFLNFIDYRTGEGMVADILGLPFAREAGAARGRGEDTRDLWVGAISRYEGDFRAALLAAAEAQYRAAAEALGQAEAHVTFGNVDHPPLMRRVLPPTVRVHHGEVVDIAGLRFGFAGGGRRSPFGPVDELSIEEALDALGPVDVLCTHVPPAAPTLYRDVITGLDERHAAAIDDYVKTHRPRLHLFGDVHQPAATRWRVGTTRCHNVGYFRATGRPLVVDGDGRVC